MVWLGTTGARTPSLFLAGEASAVIAALRSNSKYNRYAVSGRSPPDAGHLC